MQQVCDGVPQLIEQTQVVMKQERGWREVYVNKMWGRLTYDAKKGIVTMIAKCMQELEAVTVYDGYSGKEVASYGPWQGLQSALNGVLGSALCGEDTALRTVVLWLNSEWYDPRSRDCKSGL
ncbi:hypothetical protein [Tautonia sociabilis]|uniref:Uncharacterized protein n=1 Tax=Tautonia sociabilis TaxID=2080755 RepID=A0A432MIC9_9BACT|nr:hypothetical protein [Tautonia sociabilis]RUL86980.1 hypothetical protein TsocGM_14380 [Tautonia sociabilis]